jgi:hypothetical protein
MVNALHSVLPELIRPYSEKWWETAVCKKTVEKCFFNECTRCNNGKKYRDLIVPEEKLMEEVVLSTWQKKENTLLKYDQFVKAKLTLPVATLFQVCFTSSISLVCH